MNLDAPLGKYFTWAEAVHTDRAEFAAENIAYLAASTRLQSAAVDLAAILDTTRGEWGAIKINSWTRCPDLNREVGGQLHSQHLFAEAADIVPIGCDSPAGLVKVMNWLRASPMFTPGSPVSRIGQIIIEGRPKTPNAPQWTWLHVSLGAGYRSPGRCGEAFYTRLDAVGKIEYVNLAPGQEPPLQ